MYGGGRGRRWKVKVKLNGRLVWFAPAGTTIGRIFYSTDIQVASGLYGRPSQSGRFPCVVHNRVFTHKLLWAYVFLTFLPDSLVVSRLSCRRISPKQCRRWARPPAGSFKFCLFFLFFKRRFFSFFSSPISNVRPTTGANDEKKTVTFCVYEYFTDIPGKACTVFNHI